MITAVRLKVIGNNTIEGLEVEEDMPSQHRDKKLPILDMKVHISEGFIVYKHYHKVSDSREISPKEATLLQLLSHPLLEESWPGGSMRLLRERQFPDSDSR